MKYSKLLCFLFLLSETLFSQTKTQVIPDVIITQSPVSAFTQDKKAVLPVQVITQQQITESGAQNVTDALLSSGVQVNTLSGSNQTQVSLRGFGDNASQNVLILINGMPIQQPDIGTVNINQIPIQNIDHVDIWNGGGSVQYGDNAVGGVINIVTKSPDKNVSNIQTQLGSYNTKSILTGISHVFKHGFNVGLNAEHWESNNYRKHNQEKENYLNGTLEKNWMTGGVQTNYFLNQSWQQYPGALTHAQVDVNPRQTQYPHDRDFDQQLNQLAQGNFHQKLADNIKLIMPVSLSAMNGNGRLSNSNFMQSRHEQSAIPEIENHFQIKSHDISNHFSVLGDNSSYSLNYPGIYKNNSNQTQYSIADILNTALSWKWKLITGYRYAFDYNNQKNNFNPGNNSNNAHAYDVGLSWQINPVWRWYVRDNEVFRFPKVDENVYTNTGKALKPQTGNSYETGIVWKSIRWIGMLSLYQLNLRNEISTVPIFVSGQTSAANENLPPTERQGIIFNNTWNINQYVSWALMYQYVHAIITAGIYKENNIPFVANQNLSTHVIYRVNEHWQFYLEGLYTGKKRFASDVAAMSPMLGGYTIYNANVTYQYKKVKVMFQFNNMSNKHYYDYAVAVYSGSQATDYYYPAAGRNVLLTVSLIL